MKLLFRQRAFSWFDSYDIYDENENTVYVVKGQLSWGHCLKIYDPEEQQELGTVKEEILTWLPKFELYEGETCIGTLKKELTFFKPKYNIDFNGWHVEGNWLGWDYSIVDGSGRTARPWPRSRRSGTSRRAGGGKAGRHLRSPRYSAGWSTPSH